MQSAAIAQPLFVTFGDLEANSHAHRERQRESGIYERLAKLARPRVPHVCAWDTVLGLFKAMVERDRPASPGRRSLRDPCTVAGKAAALVDANAASARIAFQQLVVELARIAATEDDGAERRRHLVNPCPTL